MADKTEAKKIITQVKKDKVSLVELQFTDFLGNVKSVTISTRELPVVLQSGAWFDGSSVEGFARIHESDMRLFPDPATYALIPWRSNGEKNAVRFICDVCLPSGEPFEGDPRFILKKALQKVKKLGFTYYTGPELEFFLFKKDEKGKIQVNSRGNGYYFLFSLDETYEIKREMIEVLEAMGIKVEMGHYEVADNQHEIDFRYDEALKTADNTITLKYALKSIAQKYGYYACFMPKPIFGINGSGMHVHQSLFKKNKNAFYSKSDKYGLSRIAYQFLAGQLKHVGEISAIVSPTVNSYKRLTPGFEAPVYICWARKNRSALIRVPQTSERKTESTRLELRCPDPSANPYLAFAAMLSAGLTGIKKRLTPPKPVEEDVYEFDDVKLAKYYIDQLPGSLKEAIEEFSKGKVIKELLGKYTFDRYLATKKAEWDSFRMWVTDWEKKRYLSVL